MNKKTKWQTIKSVWKIVGVLSVILGIVASVLQISGAVNFWILLVPPLYALLITQIPIYYAILFPAVCIAVYSAIKFTERRMSCILDLEDGRKIALLCQTPRTTEFLKQQYNYWQSQRSFVFIGGYGFDGYMKRLEKEGYLNYVNEKWQVTTKALEYISKYHGDSLRT